MKKFERITKAPEEKIGKYKEMIGGSEAIFIFSMSAKEVNSGGGKRYKPDSYSDLDNRGFMGGGHASVIATAEIGKYFPNIKIVTTSYDYEDRPTLAETYAQELKKLGMSEEQIILEEKSTNTLTELVEMFKMVRDRGWGKVAIISNEIHLGRIQAMLDHLEELAGIFNLADEKFLEALKHSEQSGKLKIQLLSAEEVLPLRDEKYKKIIAAMRNSDAYKKRAEAENRGIAQIKNGTYGKK